MGAPRDFENEMMGMDSERFKTMVRGFSSQYLSEEKTMRHEAYERVADAMTDLLPTTVGSEALHRLYVDIDSETAERRVFICRGMMPAHGVLHRVIVNDELQDPLTGNRSIHIRDSVISTTQKTLTSQQTFISRAKTADRWDVQSDTGPILQIMHDRLNVISGDNYNVLIPKTRGYPKTIGTLITNRVFLEGIAAELSRLSEITQEIGHPSTSGIMS